MKRKIFALFLAINFILLNFLSFNVNAASKIIPIVNGLKAEYASGTSPSFYVLTSGYKGKVQYRVVLYNMINRKSMEITKGYTKAVLNSAKQKIVLPKLTQGYYRVLVYAKRYGSKSKFDTYLVKNVNVYLNALSITKEGTVSGSSKSNLPQLIKKDVNITGNNVNLKNAKVEGNLYVKGNNSSLDNVTVKGKVYLDPGEKGNAELNNVTAGEIVVLSGGSESIHFNNTKSEKLTIDSKSNVRVVANNSEISNIDIKTSTILQNEGTKFRNIEANTSSSNQTVEFRGNIETKVVVKGETHIKSSGTLSQLEVAAKNNAKIVVEGKVEAIELNSETKLELNNAEVKSLVANSKAEVVTNKNTKVEKVEGDKKDDVKVSGEGQVNTNNGGQNGNTSGTGNTGSSGQAGGSTGSSGTGSTGGSGGSGIGNTGGNTGGGSSGGGIVNVPVSNIVVYDSLVLLNKDDELDINYSIEPSNATNKTLVWSSNNTNVADVTNGRIKAKSVGDAVITVKTQDGKISKVLKVKVIDNGITVNIKKEAGKVAIFVKSKNTNDVVTIKVAQDNNIKYVDQISLNNNSKKLTTVLEKGTYKLFVKGLYGEVIMVDFEL